MWYLANGVKMENPVYILSNEMLKSIYIHMKLLYKHFALFEIVINLFCIVLRFFYCSVVADATHFFGTDPSRKGCIRDTRIYQNNIYLFELGNG